MIWYLICPVEVYPFLFSGKIFSGWRGSSTPLEPLKGGLLNLFRALKPLHKLIPSSFTPKTGFKL